MAAQISVELSKIKCGNNDGDKTSYVRSNRGAPVVIGGSILDMCCIVDDYPIKVSMICNMYLEIYFHLFFSSTVVHTMHNLKEVVQVALDVTSQKD